MMTVALVKALVAGSLNPTVAAFGVPYLLFRRLVRAGGVTRPAVAPRRRHTWLGRRGGVTGRRGDPATGQGWGGDRPRRGGHGRSGAGAYCSCCSFARAPRRMFSTE